jgi:hypothetical protein
MVRHANPEPHEERCPACGVAFRLADRRKRVQCPHCMEIVELGSEKPAARAPAGGSPKELAELKTRLAKLDTLEARTEALEHELAELRSAPRPAAPPPAPEPAPKLIWHAPRPRDCGADSDEISAAQQKALLANLRAIGSRRIVIQAAAGDMNAAARASQFHEIFEEAKWTAPPVTAVADRGHPLALVAQSDSTPREMAELFMALAASGFTPVSQIDPTLDGHDPILCIGHAAVPEELQAPAHLELESRPRPARGRSVTPRE